MRNLPGSSNPVTRHRRFWGFVILSIACSARHTATAPARLQPRVIDTAYAAVPADTGHSEPSDAATDNEQPIQTADAGDTPLATESSPEFQFLQKTIIWYVVGKTCERVLFNPSTPLTGTAFIRGQSFDYRIRDNELELRTFYFFKEKGMLWRDCRTAFLIGPDFITLGGANAYQTESECQAASRKAMALDDSPAMTRKKCRGVSVPVTTDEARCHASRNDLMSAKPGCITVLRSVWSREPRAK